MSESASHSEKVAPAAGSLTQPQVPDHQLLRCVARGAYGEVWLAKNVVGTLRAVKVVYRKTFSDERPYEREFAGLKSFEPVSRLHPGVISLLHIGRNDLAGYFYYVMEAGDDHVLGERIDPAQYVPKTLGTELKGKGRLPISQCLSIGLSLTSALGHLHRHGLIHRDVKPSNVIFVRGVPKLADIGLVTEISKEATAVGTEGYVPPEGPGTPEADLYGLGKLLYELCTGLDRSRFPSLPTRLDEFQDAPLLVRLNDVVLKACDPKPRKRFRSAAEMEAALRQLNDGEEATSRASSDKSVAVLPFVNMSADPENEYLSDGITEDLTMALAQVKGLRVAGRTSAFSFKGKASDIRTIADQLGVRTIVEGSVRKSDHQLRITAQLIDAEDGCCLWSERYDREMKEVFALQDEISRAIVTALKVRLSTATESSLVRVQTASTKAYQLYLQGRFYWNLRGDNLKKAMHYFELALLEDPNYALAYTGVADCWNLLGFYTAVSPQEASLRARDAAERAVQLDDNLAEAHNSRGFSHLMYEWDWRTATREFRRALEINPAYTPARYWLASIFSGTGAHQQAIAEDLHGMEFDPVSVILRTHLGWTYVHARQYDKAIQELEAALQIDPRFAIAHWVLGRAYVAEGSTERALAEFQQLLTAPPLDTWGIAWIGHTCAALGQRQKAEAALSDLQRISEARFVRPYWFALLNLGLGRIDDCFVWLQKCIEKRDIWVGWIKCDSNFDALHRDPRFAAVWRQLNIE